ncbi:ABC-type glutathione transport system ATPase component [Bradyrhizobium sp. LM6.10]
MKRFKGPDGVLRTVVDGVSFELRSGETLGVVGESGSGKSTMARMALALDLPDDGAVLFQGQAWTTLTDRERRARRRAISVIYQDPLSSFDPRWTVERIISDSLTSDVLTRGERDQRVVQLLDLVGLSRAFLDRRPLELSGGQRQRVAIARAIAPRPAVIVCDEPVSALDVLIQAQVLDLLVDLKAHLNVSYIFISHDLGVVRHLSDRVMVMRQGRVVETGTRDEIFLNPRTDYTKGLIAAVPSLARGGAANRSFSRL